MTSLLRSGLALVCLRLLVACESSGAIESDAAIVDDAAIAIDAAIADDAASADADVPDASCTLPRWGAVEDPPPCAQGLVCHLDETCVAPATPDAEGVQPLFEDATATTSIGIARGISGYAVHDDKIYWGDRGSATPNDDPNGDASIRVFDLATFEQTVIAHGFGSPPRVDGEHIYFASNARIHVRTLDAPAIDAHVVGQPMNLGDFLIEDGTVYYFYFDTPTIHHWREDEVDGVLFEAEETAVIQALVIDGERLLVEVLMPDDVTQLIAVDRQDGTSSVLLEAFRSSGAYGAPFMVSGDRVISAPAEFAQLQQHDLETGAQSFIKGTEGGTVTLEALHEGLLYFVVWEGTTSANQMSTLKRIPIDGGSAETLASSPKRIDFVRAHDGYLYWLANDGRLLVRKAL